MLIKIETMTNQKQFNTYKVGLDLEVLQQYCMEHGERRVMERGERLRVGELAREWDIASFLRSGRFAQQRTSRSRPSARFAKKSRLRRAKMTKRRILARFFALLTPETIQDCGIISTFAPLE